MLLKTGAARVTLQYLKGSISAAAQRSGSPFHFNQAGVFDA